MPASRRLVGLTAAIVLVGAIGVAAPATADSTGETVSPNGHNTTGWCAANSRPVGGDQEHDTIGDALRDDGTHPCPLPSN